MTWNDPMVLQDDVERTCCQCKITCRTTCDSEKVLGLIFAVMLFAVVFFGDTLWPVSSEGPCDPNKTYVRCKIVIPSAVFFISLCVSFISLYLLGIRIKGVGEKKDKTPLIQNPV